MIVTAVIFGVAASKDADFTAPMLVLTGQRSRDWGKPNSYSMQAFPEDPHTRLYSCLMQADILANKCYAATSVMQFKTCAKGVADCSPLSDGSWPRDFGFTACAVDKYQATPHQTNLFLSCLDRAEGVMVNAIQSPYTLTFLGSYNFVTFLVIGLAVLCSFMILNTGGFFINKEIKMNTNGHIHNFWVTNSIFSVLFSLLWTFMWFAVAVYIMFPTICDIGQLCPDGKTGFPTTPWTGIITMAILLLVMGYMLINVAEFFFDRNWQGCCGRGADEEESKTEPPPEHETGTASIFGIRPPSFKQQPYTLHSRFPGLHTTTSGFQGGLRAAGRGGAVGRGGAAGRGGTLAVRYQPGFRTTPVTYPGLARNFLGVALRPDYSSEDKETKRYIDIMPHMLASFGWTWVFADGLFFLGMLTPQNSVQTDDASVIFVRIIICRLMQLVALKLIPYSFNFDQPLDDKKYSWHFIAWKKSVDPKLAGLQMMTISVYMASLFLLVDVLYHYMMSIGLLSATQSVGNVTFAVQVSFLTVAILVPEFMRVILFFLLTNWEEPKACDVLFYFELIYLLDWLSRFILAISAIFTILPFLRDQNNILKGFVLKGSAW